MGDRPIDYETDGDEKLTLDEVAHQREVLWCPHCEHQHQSAALGFICIGCPCEKRPPFQKLAL